MIIEPHVNVLELVSHHCRALARRVHPSMLMRTGGHVDIVGVCRLRAAP